MSAVYYEVTGGDPLAYCRDFRERRSAVRREHLEFAKAHGAEGCLPGFGGGLAGLIFERDKAPPGWVASRSKTRDGRHFFHPGKRTAEGKALTKEVDALPREPSANEFAERFGVPSVLRYRKSDECYGSTVLNGVFPYTSFVAWVDPATDSFWVVLPDVEAEVARYTGEGYACEPTGWTPPEGLKRSSRARYDLAVAAAAVADEEREAA